MKAIVLDIYEESHPQDCKNILQDLRDVYSIIQHRFPNKIGSSELAPHKIDYALGENDSSCAPGTCLLCEIILRFFKEHLVDAIDGKIGEFYSDIVDHCIDKVVIYLGHSLRCRAQQI